LAAAADEYSPPGQHHPESHSDGRGQVTSFRLQARSCRRGPRTGRCAP